MRGSHWIAVGLVLAGSWPTTAYAQRFPAIARIRARALEAAAAAAAAANAPPVDPYRDPYGRAPDDYLLPPDQSRIDREGDSTDTSRSASDTRTRSTRRTWRAPERSVLDRSPRPLGDRAVTPASATEELPPPKPATESAADSPRQAFQRYITARPIPGEERRPATSVAKAPAPRDAASPELEGALAQFRKGAFEPSQDALEAIVTSTPDSGEAALWLAETQFARGQFDDAAQTLRVALAQLPPDAWGEPVRNYKRYWPSSVVFSDAVKSLESHVDNTPDDAQARALLGYHYFYLGLKSQALEELKRAHEVDGHLALADRLLQEAGEKAAPADALQAMPKLAPPKSKASTKPASQETPPPEPAGEDDPALTPPVIELPAPTKEGKTSDSTPPAASTESPAEDSGPQLIGPRKF